MAMSAAQIKALNALPLNEWVKFSDLDVSFTMIKKLKHLKKVEAIRIEYPQLKDEDIIDGTLQCKVVEYTKDDKYHPTFVKKVDDKYEMPAEMKSDQRLSALEDTMSRILDKLNQLSPGSDPKTPKKK